MTLRSMARLAREHPAVARHGRDNVKLEWKTTPLEPMPAHTHAFQQASARARQRQRDEGKGA